MKLKVNFIFEEIGGTVMAVAVGEAAKQFNGILKLNDTGKRIMELLSYETTEEEIVDCLVKEFDGDLQAIRSNVHSLISTLKSENLILD